MPTWRHKKEKESLKWIYYFRNWCARNTSLFQGGSLTIWARPDTLATWRNPLRTGRGVIILGYRKQAYYHIDAGPDKKGLDRQK